MEAGRVARFERNPRLEELLSELSRLLAPSEALAQERGLEGEQPLVLVCGAPRSGTTLLMQWLASSGAIAYPTNLLSRFFAAPSVGARIQQLLLDPRYAYGNELDLTGGAAGGSDASGPTPFESDLGKTSGPLAPNEFWYFWRRFLPTTDIEPLGARLGEADFEGLRRSLASLSRVFEQPMAMKGLMVQYDLEAFAAALPNAVFLHVERDVATNAPSLLKARERFFGTRDTWYSAQPPEFAELSALDPVQQVVGQIVHTNDHIRRGAAGLSRERYTHVPYESFCAAPDKLWNELRAMLAAQGVELPASHPGPATFTPRAPKRDEDSDAIQRALQSLESRLHTS